MARHIVQIREVPSLKLGKSDMVFDITYAKKRVGSLCVSRGHLVWRPANYRKGYWLNWQKFGDVCKKYGKKQKIYF
ncbi:MAG: hypothetical protein JW845_02350 [Dehalococcoidales bacterium]|nr:hypothetical protein [Dehalococcoidales bacterium]